MGNSFLKSLSTEPTLIAWSTGLFLTWSLSTSPPSFLTTWPHHFCSSCVNLPAVFNCYMFSQTSEPLHMLSPLPGTLFLPSDIYMACFLIDFWSFPQRTSLMIDFKAQPPLHPHISDSLALSCFPPMVLITAYVLNFFAHCLLPLIRIKFHRNREFKLGGLNNKHLLLTVLEAPALRVNVCWELWALHLLIRALIPS